MNQDYRQGIVDTLYYVLGGNDTLNKFNDMVIINEVKEE